MPAKSKSQQRLFGMVHAYQKGKLRDAPESVKEIARSISDEDAEHFAKTKHKGLPEKKAQAHPDPNYASRRAPERKKRSFLRDLAALSTAASPFLVSTLFKGRGKRLSDLADKALGGPKARLISLQDAAKAAMKESKRWGKAGYKFDGMRIAEQDVPGFADLSRFMFDASKNTGNLRVGVKSLADAHSRGIGADMFFHELGHAHDAYNQAYFKPKTLLGRIWNDYVGKNIMPYRWNPVYKEELRAWENAKKLSRRKISQESIDAALNTYRNDIYRRNAMTLSGLGSAALIGNRFFGGEKSAEYRQGFRDKRAEPGVPPDYLAKSAMAPGTVKLKTIRQAVNRFIRLRKSGRLGETKAVSDAVNLLNLGDVPPAYHPKYSVFRGEVLPDMSKGGWTSSSTVRNHGINVRHITPFANSMRAYGDGNLLVYNAKAIPGLLSGSLTFGKDGYVRRATGVFKDLSGLYTRPDKQVSAARKILLDTKSPLLEPTPPVGDAWREYWRTRDLSGLNFESAIDANAVKPSRVFRKRDGRLVDITGLYEHARQQKSKLPSGFDLASLVKDSGNWFAGLTNRQRLAAERYRAIYDILHNLGGAG